MVSGQVAASGQAAPGAQTDYYAVAAVAAEILGCSQETLFARKRLAAAAIKSSPAADARQQQLVMLNACAKASYDFVFPEYTQQLLAKPYAADKQTPTNAQQLVSILQRLSAAKAADRPQSLAEIISALQQIQLNLLTTELAKDLRSQDVLQIAESIKDLVANNNADRFANFAPLGLSVPELLIQLAILGKIAAPTVTSIRRAEILYESILSADPESKLVNTALSSSRQQNLFADDDEGDEATSADANDNDDDANNDDDSAAAVEEIVEDPYPAPYEVLRVVRPGQQVQQQATSAAVTTAVAAVANELSYIERQIDEIIGKVNAERQNLSRPNTASQATELARRSLRGVFRLFGAAEKVTSTEDTQAQKQAKIAALGLIVQKMQHREQLEEQDLQVGSTHVGFGGVVRDLAPKFVGDKVTTTTGSLLEEYNRLWQKRAGHRAPAAGGGANSSDGHRRRFG